MCHPTPRQFSGALLGVLAVMSLQGCQRMDLAADPAPSGKPSFSALDDGVLTARVRAALVLSPVVDSFHIGIDSHAGAVLLNGRATDPTQVDLAVFVAQNVRGVISVENSIVSTGESPAQIAPTSAFGPRIPTSQRPRPDGARSELQGPGQPSSAEAASTVPLSHPLGLESGLSAGNTPRQRRWVTLAHSVLGIRSIQEELLIKQ